MYGGVLIPHSSSSPFDAEGRPSKRNVQFIVSCFLSINVLTFCSPGTSIKGHGSEKHDISLLEPTITNQQLQKTGNTADTSDINENNQHLFYIQ